MFVILVYDVAAKRVGKVMKITKKYLLPVQNSAFEGTITGGKLERLKRELASVVEPEHDSVIIYKLGSVTYAQKEEIGKTKTADPYIL